MNDQNLYQIRSLPMSRDAHNGHPTIAGHTEAAELLATLLWTNNLIPYVEE